MSLEYRRKCIIVLMSEGIYRLGLHRFLDEFYGATFFFFTIPLF